MKKSYKVALYGVMFATIFVAMMIDRIISLALPISFAFCTLLTTFSFCLAQDDASSAFFAGLCFGLASLVKEFIFPGATFAALGALYVPVAIIPRLAVGIGAYGAYKLMQKLLKADQKGKKYEVISITVGVFIGLILNTVLYLSALNIAKMIANIEFSSLFTVIKTVIFTNIIPEYLISMIFVSPIVLSVRKSLKIKKYTDTKEAL